MAPPLSPKLAEMLAAAEKRKHDEIRKKLGLSSSLRIEDIELESLAYHLGERSGPVFVKLDGEVLRVAENEAAPGLKYRGDAAQFLLSAWGISREQARKGVTLEVKDGKRAA